MSTNQAELDALHGRALTDREVLILRLIADGRSDKQIAGELVISPHTVKSHLCRIYAKLGATGRANAVAHCYRLGVLHAPGHRGGAATDDLDLFVREQAATEVHRYQDLLGAIELYIGWRQITRHLTTPQRELFADAVEGFSVRLHEYDPAAPKPRRADRWWRDGQPTPTPGDLR